MSYHSIAGWIIVTLLIILFGGIFIKAQIDMHRQRKKNK